MINVAAEKTKRKAPCKDITICSYTVDCLIPPLTAAFKLFAFAVENRRVVKIDFLYRQREINFSSIDSSKAEKLLPSI